MLSVVVHTCHQPFNFNFHPKGLLTVLSHTIITRTTMNEECNNNANKNNFDSVQHEGYLNLFQLSFYTHQKRQQTRTINNNHRNRTVLSVCSILLDVVFATDVGCCFALFANFFLIYAHCSWNQTHKIL